MFQRFGIAILAFVMLPANSPANGPARAFGVREGVQQIDLSPDGRRIVYISPAEGSGSAVIVQSLDGGDPGKIVLRSSGNPERIAWCKFAGKEDLVCRIQIMELQTGTLIPYERLIAISADGGAARQLGQRASFYDARIRQFDATVLDWLPEQNGKLLMSREYVPEVGRGPTRLYRRADGLGVDQVDVRSLGVTQVEPPNPEANAYISDGRGNVRIMASAAGPLGTRMNYYYRKLGESEWRSFGSYDFDSGEGLIPLDVDPELDAAYALRKLNGRFALYRVGLSGSLGSELVFAHDRVDVDDLVRAGRGSRIIGLTYAEERRHAVYFDPEYKALAQALGKAIPDLPLIDFVSASNDGTKLLIHAGSDSDPGRYYVFDRANRTLNEILLVRPELEHVPLASVQPVSYDAGDGVSIPAYLTLPPGKEARNLPAIVLPHGGPSARDEWGFDWLAQYLAHLGYAVLQPNYRGSAGYGDDWLQENGFQGWRTSIGDIVAGARWMVSEGIADPDRMAMVGWSYGGYAALQAAAVEPDMFDAVVAIAPVTDLQQLKLDFVDYASSRSVAKFVGSGPHVEEGSPLHNAARITAPVLLFHGDRDLNVKIHHSDRMHRALLEAGKRSEFVPFADLEHDLGSSDARTLMLRRIGEFLEQELTD